jgi:hypothetical protein
MSLLKQMLKQLLKQGLLSSFLAIYSLVLIYGVWSRDAREARFTGRKRGRSVSMRLEDGNGTLRLLARLAKALVRGEVKWTQPAT